MPIDFSDCAQQALGYATAFAEVFGAGVVLLHVVEPAVGGDHYLMMGPAMGEANENLFETSRERLTALAEKHIGSRVPSETLVRMGRAPSEISDTAKALGVDLIIMGTHGHTALSHVLMGSTAERVVRQAQCPVLTVRLPDRVPSASAR